MKIDYIKNNGGAKVQLKYFVFLVMKYLAQFFVNDDIRTQENKGKAE